MILCLGTTPTLSRTMQFARIRIGDVSRTSRVYEYAAGKAVNAARAIRTLGEPAACVSPCGGAMGRRLSDRLLDTLGDGHLGVEMASESRLCITAIDDEAKLSSELIQESSPLAEVEGERLIATFVERLSAARVAVLSGSLAPGLATDFYARCIERCAAAGLRTILDTSGEPLRAAMISKPSAIKINAAELGQLIARPLDGEPDIIEAAQGVAPMTGGTIIVTRGAAATVVVRPDGQAFTCDVPRVDVVSAIGSGDSFAGGLAVGLARGRSMADAVRLATAAAAANATTPHAAHFTLDAVDALLARPRPWP